MKKTALALVALTALSPPALAQAPLNFIDVDADASGELSFAELQAVWPDLTQDQFAAADLDANGNLSADELNGLQPATLSEPIPLDGAAPAPADANGTGSKSLIDTTDD